MTCHPHTGSCRREYRKEGEVCSWLSSETRAVHPTVMNQGAEQSSWGKRPEQRHREGAGWGAYRLVEAAWGGMKIKTN